MCGIIVYMWFFDFVVLVYVCSCLCLCVCNVGLQIGFHVYLGKEGHDDFSASDTYALNVVVYLARPYQQTYRVICFDNWFSSVPLARALLDVGLYCLGTIRKTRKGLPLSLLYNNPQLIDDKKKDKNKKAAANSPKKFSKEDRKWKKYESDSRYEKNGALVASAWSDTKVVYYLYNHLSASQAAAATTVKRRSDSDRKDRLDVQVPRVVKDYQQTMGAVDRSDQACSYYRSSNRSKRFYIPLFYHFLTLVIRCSVTSFRHS